MEIALGKKSGRISLEELARRVDGRCTLVDIGTGDGKFVLRAAKSDPALFAVGVDACRENLREAARQTPANALFVIAAAESLPDELNGLADRLVINFPWGSLLKGLLEMDPALMDGLARVARPGARFELRLNASAAAKAGYTLEDAAGAAAAALTRAGFDLTPPAALSPADLRALPSSWARRLASGQGGEPGSTPALALTGCYTGCPLGAAGSLLISKWMISQSR
ncbi:MAG: class I SAM-dependent methyltransferase [Chloroflexi bacterium]|nr:class I SAM-dependent methyltransferase [Chloroflexota bacterium]